MPTTVIATEPVYARDGLHEVKAWADLGDDWVALLRFALVGREFLLAEIRAFAKDGDRTRTHWSGSRSAVRKPLPKRRLHDLSVLDVLRHVEREFEGSLPRPELDLADLGWGTEAETARERWAQTALTYALAVARSSDAPTRETADILGREYTKVRDDLHAARRAGFLTTEGRRGVSGGELTNEGWSAVAFVEGDEIAERYRRALGR